MKRKILIGVLIGVCAALCPARSWAGGGDDLAYWSQYTVLLHDGEHVDLNLFFDFRFDDNIGENDLSLASIQAKYDFIKNLSFGTNYTYILDRKFNSSAGKSEYLDQHRLELEANPYYKIGDWLKFDNRNRVEFRWIENNGSYNTRSRHRVRLTFPLVKDLLPKQDGIYMDSEFFYNYAEHSYDENRSVPLGIKFNLSEQLGLSLFYMVRSQKSVSTGEWSTSHVLGTNFSIKF
ncbi:MAG TPA: DUF2490 domain-containing protein [Candidatus Omnitrophota bacterium]|nr:DUF2490 domain-containing protein [Candidatus Omnitrophota bacterium]